ncbi:MAG: hypothetical protein EB015_04420 [Methylocystaceae bacterium]|nr:hypothetical protein [Methylocystaceae bacterium]
MESGKSHKQGNKRTVSSNDKLKRGPDLKNNDWYKLAYKRFSISSNNKNFNRDPLASLIAPIKIEIK